MVGDKSSLALSFFDVTLLIICLSGRFFVFNDNMNRFSFSLHHIWHYFFHTLFFRDAWFFAFHVISGILFGIQVAVLFLNISLLKNSGQEYIALHTKQYIGVDFYSSWYVIFFAPLAGVSIFLINYFCAKKVRVLDKVLFYSLSFVSIWVQLGIIMALGHIIKINAF